MLLNWPVGSVARGYNKAQRAIGQDFLKGPVLDFSTRLYLDAIGDALSQAIGVVRDVQVRYWIHLVVEELGGAPWVGDAVSKLALDGYRLEIARNLVEHKVDIHATRWKCDDLCVVLEVEEGKSWAFPGDPC